MILYGRGVYLPDNINAQNSPMWLHSWLKITQVTTVTTMILAIVMRPQILVKLPNVKRHESHLNYSQVDM
jgi:hypothetical protein